MTLQFYDRFEEYYQGSLWVSPFSIHEIYNAFTITLKDNLPKRAILGQIHRFVDRKRFR